MSADQPGPPPHGGQPADPTIIDRPVPTTPPTTPPATPPAAPARPAPPARPWEESRDPAVWDPPGAGAPPAVDEPTTLYRDPDHAPGATGPIPSGMGPPTGPPVDWSPPDPYAYQDVGPVASAPVGAPSPAVGGRGMRGGIGAALAALVVILAAGNEFTLDALFAQVREPWYGALYSANLFAHFSLLPGDTGTGGSAADFYAHLFMVDDTGGGAIASFSLGDDRIWHWLFNFGRIGLLLLAVWLFVGVSLRRHAGGLLARTVAAWGAVALGVAVAGAVSSTLFYLVTDRGPAPTLAITLSAAGYGMQWALLWGLPIAFVGAAMARVRR